MRRVVPRRPGAPMVVALLALFVALGGTGYAALKLPKNSVGAKQLKRNAVRSSKVKNRSLLAEDFKAGQLPAGPRGFMGARGPAGPRGTAKAYGHVSNDGSIDTVHSSPGVTSSKLGNGQYCVKLPATLDADHQVIVAMPDISEDTTLTGADGNITTFESGGTTCSTNGLQVVALNAGVVNNKLAVEESDSGFNFVVP